MAAPSPLEAPAGDDRHRFLNRELSWLDFNERVLAVAEDPDQPLLERAKFIAIFHSNLDEFFQVRVAGLKDQVAAGVSKLTPDGRSPGEQLLEIRDRVSELVERAEACFLADVAPALAEVGVAFSGIEELDDDDRKHLDEVFDSRIFPVLTPLAVDPGHPFPYISNLSLNLAVVVLDPTTGQRRFARVKVPPLLPRFVVMPDGERFVPLEQVIASHLDCLFPGMEVVDHFAFRVTRNADLTLEEEEADDLLAAVEMEVRRRRFGRTVRLELDASATSEIRELLVRELDVTEEDLYEHRGPIGLTGLFAVAELDRPDLQIPPWAPVTPAELAPAEEGEPADLFAVIARHDVLVHHPYDSFSTSVSAFVRQAAADPQVLAIKVTLYRTTVDTPIIDSLIRAAEAGKQVAALVELKARFDEERNIEWAQRLERAGVHVTYGLLGLKTHTKTVLVVRDEGDAGLRRYCHIGTGNYNARTARIYEDLGLFTADAAVGEDLTHLFNYLTGYGREVAYRRLLVAPHGLRSGIAGLIDGEIAAGPGRGRITMKMNSLVDPALIDHLYAASSAGIDVDLVVRGICCLRPGVPGLSERIRVRSIVGRFLEHSRVYRFANGAGPGQPVHLIGSADLMPRNLDRRVEALVPVTDARLRARLDEVLEINLADDTLAWELGGDGAWSSAGRGRTTNAHLRLMELAEARAAADR